MTTNSKSKKIGVSQRKAKPSVNPMIGQLARFTPMVDLKKVLKKPQPTQSELFVRSRNTVLQYLVDVFALAFVLAVLFMLLQRVVK